MTESDLLFPLEEFSGTTNAFERGIFLAEKYTLFIKELAQIRRRLLLEKNPRLKSSLKELAHEQWNLSCAYDKKYSLEVMDELKGLKEQGHISLEDLVILNNYTDFRDIALPEEGCSTIAKKQGTQYFSGQTWDMHDSAKRFLMVQKIQQTLYSYSYILTVVGCVGLMGINNAGVFVGVNNINTQDARPGILWPLFVRALLHQQSYQDAEGLMFHDSPVTSGHSYLLSDDAHASIFEITPTYKEKICSLKEGQEEVIFHTNHCLSKVTATIEDKNSLSSTTFDRYELLQKYSQNVTDANSLFSLLTSHHQYPKSLCSHYQTSAIDPSQTCGGGLFSHQEKKGAFWRECPQFGKNFKKIDFSF